LNKTGGIGIKRIAFIFPGQGAQYVGMGKELADKYKSSSDVFDEASDALGFDIRKMVFDGDEETLKITENTQPAILTTSIACLKPLTDNGIRAEITAGLSLGEYTALVYAESMEFRDAVCLVRKRGKYMQEAVPEGVGKMTAVIGLEDDVVVECCKQASKKGVVEPVNFNCPGQVVVAGEVSAVDEAARLCAENGAKRVIPLQVSAPFHSSMIKSAGERIKTEIERITFRKPKIPVISNVTADYVDEPSQIADLLVKQISNPVLWRKSVEKMISAGIDTFVEIGPGKVLSGFVRRINKEVKVLNVENIETLDNTLCELSK
jgi:[acyl-carrier-protein] S-malonyltransferase